MHPLALGARADLWLLETVDAARTPVLDAAFRALSSTGLRVFLVLAAAALALRVSRRPALLVALPLALALVSLVTHVLKHAVDRPRPSLTHPAMSPLVGVPDNASFPSGHASSAFAAAVVLGAFAPRLRWPLLLVAALIAISRVWLGVHYPSDVAAGAALGAVGGVVSVAAVERVARRPRAGTPRPSRAQTGGSTPPASSGSRPRP